MYDRIFSEVQQRVRETGKYENIIYEKEEGIATLTFNRPQVMNAQNPPMIAEMQMAVEDADEDAEVRVLIITGAGRGFHAGDDVRQMFLAPDRAQRRTEMRGQRIRKGIIRRGGGYLLEFYKPAIAAVNGPAVGAGLDWSLGCDIRIASENAKFGWFFVRRGLPSTGTPGAVMMLPHIIGLSRAMEMMMSGELIDAEEALRIGLVSKIVPQERLMDETKEMARKFMTEAAPLAQIAVKRGVRRAMFDPTTLAEFMPMIQAECGQTEDFLEGSKAFAEKRPAAYKGR